MELHSEERVIPRCTVEIGRLSVSAERFGRTWTAYVYDKEAPGARSIASGEGADEYEAIAAALYAAAKLGEDIATSLEALCASKEDLGPLLRSVAGR